MVGTTELMTAESGDRFLRRAHTFLRTGRGAPVLLEVPADVAMEEIGDTAPDYTPVAPRRSAGDPADVRSAVAALLAANKPMIFAGQGVLWAEASDQLIQLAELLDAPVATTNSGKSAFPENHPLTLGTAGNTLTKMARHYLTESDAVFGIGASFTTNLASTRIPGGKVLVQSTVDARDLNKEHHLIRTPDRRIKSPLLRSLRRFRPKTRAAQPWRPTDCFSAGPPDSRALRAKAWSDAHQFAGFQARSNIVPHRLPLASPAASAREAVEFAELRMNGMIDSCVLPAARRVEVRVSQRSSACRR